MYEEGEGGGHIMDALVTQISLKMSIENVKCATLRIIIIDLDQFLDSYTFTCAGQQSRFRMTNSKSSG